MTRRLRHLIALLAAAWLTLAGCYDGDQLVEEVRSNAIRSRLEEVSLGLFRTTLPRDTVPASPMEVELELFGTAAHYKVPRIQKAIQADEHRLRQAMLVAIRETTPMELAEPSLASLRKRLLEVANAELGDTRVDRLGIRQVRFIPL